MAETTKIEWTDHTFNAWTGCTKVSPACDHCYAESWAKRSGIVEWGNHPRRRTSEAYWLQPLKWNGRAEKEGVRRKVFCCSLADVFDNQAPTAWREDLWRLIWATPALDWLLLTKRPQNIVKMLPNHTGRPWPYPNVWLGTTVENQEEAVRRIPHLLDVPATIKFLSCEPLLGPIRFSDVPGFNRVSLSLNNWWVIAGGESGPGARVTNPAWARSLRDQCAIPGVPFFWKQNGEWAHVSTAIDGNPVMERIGKKRAGALLDGQAWRQFPPATGALDF